MKKALMAGLTCAILVLLMQPGWVQETEKADTKKVAPVSKKTNETPDVTLKEIEPFMYCAVEMKGSYGQHTSAFMTLYSEAMKQSVAYDDIPFGIYWNSPLTTAEKDLEWDIGFKLLEEQEVKEPLTVKEWNFTVMVARDYEGPFSGEKMNNTYQEIYQWIGENGYAPAGPVMERYLRAPQPNDAGELCGSVEILVPVQKVEK